MKFLNVLYFVKEHEQVQDYLIKNGVLPVISNCIQNWEYINAIDEFGQRKYKYIINEGSSRSGKTYSMIDCIDRYAREKENKRLTVWRDTKTDCKKTVLNDVLRHFKKTNRYKVDQDFNKTESIFTYTSTASTFEIHGTDDEETVHGLTQDAAWLNEPYKISRETFDQIDQRTSDFIFIDWNPKKSHWIEDIKKSGRAITIHSTFNDNYFCPPEQRAKILSYKPVKFSNVVDLKLINEKDALTYDLQKNELKFTNSQIDDLRLCQQNEVQKSANAFNWQVYGLGIKSEKPNRIFHWNEISLAEYQKIDAKIYVGVDWGSVDPWGILEIKYRDGCLYLHELNYTCETEIRKRLTISELSQIQGNDEGIVTWLFNKLGISKSLEIICDSNRLVKIAILRREGWTNALPATKGAGSILDGIDLLQNLTVYYTECSENIKFEQENYSRQIDRTGYVLDEPEDMDNHLIDPTRYVALYLQSRGIIKKV